MNTAVRSLLLAVYLTGTVFAPVLHLVFHDGDHDHVGGGIRRHPEADHSHEHFDGHPHGHPHEHTPTGTEQIPENRHHDEDHTPRPEHGSGSAAHFDAALSDGVAQIAALDGSVRVWMREGAEPVDRPELLDHREVAVRGPPAIAS